MPSTPARIAPDSLQIRRSAFAQIYNHPIEIQRSDALAFYEQLTREVGHYPEMLNEQTGMVLRRRGPGQQLNEVQINRVQMGPAPNASVPAGMRFLFAETGSARPVSEFSSEAASAGQAYRSTWGEAVGRVTITEVAFIGTVVVNHPQGSHAFLRQYLVSSTKDVSHLGRDFPIVSVVLTAPLTFDVTKGLQKQQLLDSAEIRLSFEPYAADQRNLQFTTTYKWPLVQTNVRDIPLPSAVRAQIGNVGAVEMNQETHEPSRYIDVGYQYITGNVIPYLQAISR